MMNLQSHKNILWNLNFISNHIFMSSFAENNTIWFTFFFDMFDIFLDSKKRAFRFWGYLF